jgi:hypothetical protein
MSAVLWYSPVYLVGRVHGNVRSQAGPKKKRPKSLSSGEYLQKEEHVVSFEGVRAKKKGCNRILCCHNRLGA